MTAKDHWEQVYSTKPTDGVSWYQPHAGQSLALIRFDRRIEPSGILAQRASHRRPDNTQFIQHFLGASIIAGRFDVQ